MSPVLFSLLQSNNSMMYFKKESDPRTTWILGGILAFAFLLMIIGNVRNKSKNLPHFSKSAFKRESRQLGLSKEQTRTLLELIKNHKVNRPFMLLKNGRTLNVTLGKAIADIEGSDLTNNQKESRKLSIYRIKQTIERLSQNKKQINSTREIKLGDHISLAEEEDGIKYDSVVTSNLKEFLCVQIPKTRRGEELRFSKGTKLQLFFSITNSESISFTSKIMGYNKIKKINSYILSHSTQLTRTHQRRYRRKSIKSSCFVYPIQVMTTGHGRRKKREAIVLKNQGRNGTLIDISAGGCCISMTKPLTKGSLIKLSFEPTRGTQVVMFGKIVDTRKQTRIKSTIHIMFTKASSKNLNKINEYIYDFNL